MKKHQQNIKPPFLAEIILKLFFPDGGAFSTIGDLFESYQYVLEKEGKLRADFWYINQVYKSIVPLIINTIFGGTDIINNYIKLAWRNFKKHKTHSAINLIGLTFGITASIIILLFIIDELGFDKFNNKYDRIARIVTEEYQKNAESRFYPLSAGIIGETLVDDYPEIVDKVHLVDRSIFGRFTTEYEDFKHHEGDFLFADPSFFRIFDYEIIFGNPQNLLSNPNEVVLTETTAKMFFGDDNPIGKVIKTNSNIGSLKVTGLMKDLPGNSHLQFSMLISFNSINNDWPEWKEILNNWNISSVKTYLLFNNKNSLANFGGKLKTFQEKNKTNVFGVTEAIQLQPLYNVHFDSNNLELDNNYGARSITTIYVLGVIGFFILLSACINYSNLSIARYFNRAKEMGMRKVVGATKSQLFTQILSESIFMTVLAVVISIGLVLLILPTFNTYLEKSLSFTSINSFLFIVLLLSLSLIVGIVSGSLPAFFLTKLKTVSLMKMKLQPGGFISMIKKSLVVLQFVISIIMVFATITVYNQLNFIKNKNLGFNKEQMIVIDINSGEARSSFQSIKAEFLKSNMVKKVSVISRVPGDWKDIEEVPVNNWGADSSEEKIMFAICVDEDFLNTFEIKLKEGNNFTGNELSDSLNVIVNNSALKSLNITDPIGKFIQIRDRKKTLKYKIAGVVEDFNFHSLHKKIGPMVIGYRNSPIEAIDYFAAKIKMTDLPNTIDYLKTVHEKFDKTTVFEYNFLDEKIAEFYKQEVKESTIINAASFISILIACLGLFGLSAYAAQQKIKEIGIRKVLGVSVSEITMIFSKEFVRLIFIAAFIALPLSFYFMNKWLEGFAYKITIGFNEVLLSALAAFLISLLTIGYQAIKSANMNPIETIRNE